MRRKIFFSVLMMVLIEASAFAEHPLITDDTGTQGKGKYQIELSSELAHAKEDDSRTDSFEFSSALSYGIADSVDIVLNIPYEHIRLKEDGQINTVHGLSDISLEIKWRFHEKDGLSFAVKPGLTFPTGDHDKGLGAGRVACSAFFIMTKEIQPWAFHLNLGYIRNENKADERKNLWHASLAGEVEVMRYLKIVGNIGMERNSDRTLDIHPAFILGGVIYSLTENIDIDFGIKGGLNKPEADYAVLAGISWRF